MRTLPMSSALSAVCESLSPSRMGVICGPGMVIGRARRGADGLRTQTVSLPVRR